MVIFYLTLQYWFCESLITDITNEHAPMKTRKVRPRKPPFLNKTLDRAIMDKARHFHRKNTYPNRKNWESYRVRRNQATSVRKKSMRAYFQKKCTPDNESKQNTFWPAIKTFFTNKGHKTSTDMQIQNGDNVETNPQKVANIMNDFFVNVASIGETQSEEVIDPSDGAFCEWAVKRHENHESIKAIRTWMSSHPLPESLKDFTIPKVSPSSVEKIFCSLNPRKAAGYDSLPPTPTPRIIKAAVPAIASPLSSIPVL